MSSRQQRSRTVTRHAQRWRRQRDRSCCDAGCTPVVATANPLELILDGEPATLTEAKESPERVPGL